MSSVSKSQGMSKKSEKRLRYITYAMVYAVGMATAFTIISMTFDTSIITGYWLSTFFITFLSVGITLIAVKILRDEKA